MAQKAYYVDTSIWLNLFKKEGDPKQGVPYWKIAKDFVDTVMFSKDDQLIYSGFILKELKFNINNEMFYLDKLTFFENEDKIKFVKATPDDYSFARKLESEFRYDISFFDCMHIAICKRMNYALVTRDSLLIQHAIKYVEACTPEKLLPKFINLK